MLQVPAARPRQLHVVHVHRGGTNSIAIPFDINVHGRHVDVTPEVRSVLYSALWAPSLHFALLCCRRPLLLPCNTI